MDGRTELAGAWMSYGYNRIKGRAASACVFHCVGTLHASPVVHAAKVDSTTFVMLDVNLDNALDFREGLPDSGEIYSALKRAEEHTSELQSLIRHSYAVFCLKKKIN